MEENPESIPIRPPMPTRAEFDQIVQTANGGDCKALYELRRVLDEHPQIWRRLGNPSAVAGNSFLRLASNGNRLVSGSISRYVNELRKELAGPAPTRLERLAIERLLLAWAQANFVNTVLVSVKNMTPGTLTAWHKRQRQSSGELDKAMKSLATLRRLLPSAEKQAPTRTRRA